MTLNPRSCRIALGAAVLTGVVSLAGVHNAAAQVTLNNITTNSASGGTASGGQVWDTIAGGPVFDVFLIRGTDVANGAIINSGLDRSLAEALTVNGDVTYTLLTQPGNYNPQGGLNLFFNGATAPQITAFAAFNTLATPPTATSTGSSVFNPFGGSSNGSGSLSFTNGGVSVSLISLRFFNANVDRVNATSVLPNPSTTGGDDLAVQFTVRVSSVAVPESGTLALALSGAMFLAGPIAIARRRKAQR